MGIPPHVFSLFPTRRILPVQKVGERAWLEGPVAVQSRLQKVSGECEISGLAAAEPNRVRLRRRLELFAPLAFGLRECSNMPAATEFRWASPKSGVAAAARLSQREWEILARLAEGDTYKEIASCFAISVQTVNGHIKSVYRKLGVHCRTHAVIQYLDAIRSGEIVRVYGKPPLN